MEIDGQIFDHIYWFASIKAFITHGISHFKSDSRGGTHTLEKGNLVSSGALSRTTPLEFKSDIALLDEAVICC